MWVAPSLQKRGMEKMELVVIFVLLLALIGTNLLDEKPAHSVLDEGDGLPGR